MGTWGTAIFSNDTASDVRGDFRNLIGEGLSPEEATDRMLAEYGDDPDFWLGLAVTQWKCGRLQDSVKTKALQIIDSGEDLQRWSKDAKLVKARAGVLAKTRALLVSPQPVAKHIPKAFREANDWEVGELISYRMLSGKHLVFRVVRHHVDKNRKSPTMDLLDYYDDIPPTLEQARNLPARILVDKDWFTYTPCRRFTIYALSEREIPKKRLTRLGLYRPLPDPNQDLTVVRGMAWRSVDANFERRLTRPLSWRPGPGGDDYQHWELGDVLAHQIPTGQYLLFHLVGRHHGHRIDGAPIVAHLDWQETSLPSSEALTAGTVKPRVYAAEFAAQHGLVPSCVVYVLVHADDDAVDASKLQRVGNFEPTYALGRPPQAFASIPLIVKRFERDRALVQPVTA